MSATDYRITAPAYHTVVYHGVPMYRAQAWALIDYVKHGGHLVVNSADRRDSVLRRYAPSKHGQQYLYNHQNQPGFFPANKPRETSHCLYSDGNRNYRYKGRQIPRGGRLPKFMLGIDATNHPGGDAARIVSWLNSHGYKAVRPYPSTSERHHFVFLKSPATNARRRLAAGKAKKVATKFLTAWLTKEERKQTLEIRRLRRDRKDIPRRSEIKNWLEARYKLLRSEKDQKKYHRRARASYIKKVIDNDSSIRIK